MGFNVRPGEEEKPITGWRWAVSMIALIAVLTAIGVAAQTGLGMMIRDIFAVFAK